MCTHHTTIQLLAHGIPIFGTSNFGCYLHYLNKDSDEDINTTVTPTAPAAIHTGPICRISGFGKTLKF